MVFKLVVMGVSGCGKSTLMKELASQLAAQAVEGDQFHSPQNVQKMRLGIALTDVEREPWLDQIGTTLAASSSDIVVSCSALKVQYRDQLRIHVAGLRFVYIDIDRPAALLRVASRQGHFFSPDLVDSQFATLQPPTRELGVFTVSAETSLEAQASQVLSWLIRTGQASWGGG